VSMIVRPYTDEDLEAIKRIHAANGLPPACLPACCKADANGNVPNAPLFFMRKILEDDGRVALASFLKLTAEAFVFVDHEHADPERRWIALQKLTAATLSEAAKKGVEDVTAWIPPELNRSFGERLVALGAIKSPWQSYSFLLE
jgi:hypothetical protein